MIITEYCLLSEATLRIVRITNGKIERFYVISYEDMNRYYLPEDREVMLINAFENSFQKKMPNPVPINIAD